MSALSAASEMLREIAGQCQPGDGVKSALRRVSRRLPSWSTRKIKSVWYCEHNTLVTADEYLDLERAAARQKASPKNEIDEIRLRIQRLESLLAQDPEFHGPEVAALRNLASGMRGQD